MNCVDTHRRVDKGVTVGNCRINRLFLRTNWYCMCGSFQQGLQHIFDRFYAAYDQTGTKFSTKEIEILCLLRHQRQCFLQVKGNSLQQVERFKYLGVVFTCDESPNTGIDTLIGKAKKLCVSFIALW